MAPRKFFITAQNASYLPNDFNINTLASVIFSFSKGKQKSVKIITSIGNDKNDDSVAPKQLFWHVLYFPLGNIYTLPTLKGSERLKENAQSLWREREEIFMVILVPSLTNHITINVIFYHLNLALKKILFTIKQGFVYSKCSIFSLNQESFLINFHQGRGTKCIA